MTTQNLRYRIGSFLKRIFPNGDSREINALKQEIQMLRKEVQSIETDDRNTIRQEMEILRNDLQGSGDRELAMLRQEIDILRNEIQENIAAINRLEVLTLAQRLELLDDFGKALPPTFPGKTRQSYKSKGFSFGIITNGKRNHKLASLIESIRAQNLTSDSFEILIAGSVADVPGYSDVRKFPMDEAASEGRLGAMRNVLAKEARFNKFVSLDDDFLLHPKWAQAVNEIKGDFDIATGIILNPDLSRYCDWVNLIDNFTFLRAYHEMFDKCQYMTGGYGIYKDVIFLEHSWNDDLGFYQGEDVSFSRRLFNAGYQLKFIPKAIVMHDDERYRQKGYGVIRSNPADPCVDLQPISLRMEKLCPRSLS
ncbi:MAG TPA: hypothetical protein VK463_03710 [Desulfomonilaceae bacterium]|nr:hypothetical protein [Desulfomonilaceae bacterium]